MELQTPNEGTASLRQSMNRWVAQFAPLVMENRTLTAEDIRLQLAIIRRLKDESERLAVMKSTLTDAEDAELLNTFQLAIRQLPQMETDLRHRLNFMAPGDPESRPCLTMVQDRLQEQAARQEIGLTSLDSLQPVEAKTADPSAAAAVGIGVIALGWNGFTLFHATIMLGGMLKSFGFLAILMGLFYLPFFAVGLLMVAGVAYALCTETIRLEGNQLTITYQLARLTYRRKHKIDMNQLVKHAEIMDSDSNKMRKQDQIEFTDTNGKPVRLARGLSQSAKESLMHELNTHILSSRHHTERAALSA